MEKDLYEILGVKKNATEIEMRKAFHQLAKKYHPDMNPGDKVSEQKFKEVNLAYEVLKDPKKKAQYDAMRAAGADPFARARAGAGGAGGQWRPGQPSQGNPFGGGEGFGDFGLGDLFEEIFSGGGRRSAGRGSPRWGEEGATFRRKGADQETQLTISFMEAVRGGERYIELTDGRKLTVTIPEGVSTLSKIKLKGQGEPGVGGAPAGDLILTLTVLPHGHFIREEDDILLRVPIAFHEAVLGAEIEVPTLDGKATLRLPAGVSSGQRLKLAGKGIKSTKTGSRGDQFVEVSIKIPKPVGAKYLEAAKLAQEEPFNPRAQLW